MAEITRKSVLLECLSIMREEQRIMSKNYNCLEPAKGMEEAWEQGREKIRILEEHIQALDSEHVLKALASWQMEEKPPKENNSEFRIQNSESRKPIIDGIQYEFDPVMGHYRVMQRIRYDSLDHEDGTMELR